VKKKKSCKGRNATFNMLKVTFLDRCSWRTWKLRGDVEGRVTQNKEKPSFGNLTEGEKDRQAPLMLSGGEQRVSLVKPRKKQE